MLVGLALFSLFVVACMVLMGQGLPQQTVTHRIATVLLLSFADFVIMATAGSLGFWFYNLGPAISFIGSAALTCRTSWATPQLQMTVAVLIAFAGAGVSIASWLSPDPIYGQWPAMFFAAVTMGYVLGKLVGLRLVRRRPGARVNSLVDEPRSDA